MVACARHGVAAGSEDHCRACLLERVLGDSAAAVQGDWLASESSLTIQMPIGHGPTASVYVVCADGAVPRLLRLKTWRTPAPGEFLPEFARLKARLDHLGTDRIVAPLAAWLDHRGRPSVLSPFRPGVSILARHLTSRRASPADHHHLASLAADVRTAHAQGLVHGSIVHGNVMVAPDRSSAFLLDFGLRALVAGPAAAAASPRADLTGFAALSRLLEAAPGDARDDRR